MGRGGDFSALTPVVGACHEGAAARGFDLGKV